MIRTSLSQGEVKTSHIRTEHKRTNKGDDAPLRLNPPPRPPMTFWEGCPAGSLNPDLASKMLTSDKAAITE